MRLLLLSLALAAPVPAQDPTGADLFLAPDRRALVIGAGDYAKYGKLRFAAEDARALADLLEQRYDFEVTLLHDAPRQPGELQADYLDRLPTSSVVLDRLERVVTDAGNDDTDLFLFFYCGHGEGRAGGDVLIPTDIRAGSADRLAISVQEDVIGRLRAARMRNSLVLIDACRSGEASEFGRDLAAEGDQLRMAVLLGCQPGEVSYEDAVVGHGVFTHELIEALGQDELSDPETGGLWFSAVAEQVIRGAQELTLREDPPQRPERIGDRDGDVLIDARLPAGIDGLESLVNLEGLDPAHGLAAYALLAEHLWDRGEVSQALQMFEIAELLAPLPPQMALNLAALHSTRGDALQAGRVYAQLREREADSHYGLVAAVLDSTGALTIAERAEAAAQLSQVEGIDLNLDHFIVMLELQVAAGKAELARAWAQALIPDVPPENARARLLLESTAALYGGDVHRALGTLRRAEGLPGNYPSDASLQLKQLQLCRDMGRFDLALKIADEAVERWPQVGGWRLQRAAVLRQLARSQDDLDAVHAELTRALDLDLAPAEVLEAAYLDGGRVLGLAPRLNELAAQHAQAWQPALAAAFADQGDDLKQRVAAAAALTPNPVHVYLAAARLTYDGVQDQAKQLLAGPEEERPSWEVIQSELKRIAAGLHGRLFDFVDEFRDEPQAWSLLQELSQIRFDHEGFVRLFERRFGARIDAGLMSAPLVDAAAYSYLASGRLDRFRQLRSSLRYETVFSNDLRWAEAAYLAAAGRDEEARAWLQVAPAPPSDALLGLDAALRAYLAAREGALVEAHMLLHDAPVLAPYSLPFVLLTLAELEAWDQARPLWQVMDQLHPEGAVFAWAAAAARMPQATPRETLAMYMPGAPLMHSLTLADQAGLEAFKADYAFRVKPPLEEGRFLEVAGWTLYLTPGRGGRVTGELVAPGDATVWSLRGTLDGYGNFEGSLDRGQAGSMDVLAKLRPWADFAGLQDPAQLFVLYDEDGARHELLGRPLEDE